MSKKGIRTLLFAAIAAAAFMVHPNTATTVEAAKSVKTGFTTISGKSYYIDKDGSKHKGWLTLNGKKYYFNTKTGVQQKGWMKDSKGNKRYFTSGAGVMATGWLENSKGQHRYFDPKTGIMKTKWMTLEGERYYFYSNSGVAAEGTFLTDGKSVTRYFYNDVLYMAQNTWLTNSKKEKRYFYKNTGAMAKGLKEVGDDTYFFNKSSGKMETGWKNGGNGSKRYFDPETGKMYIGTHTIGGRTYYFDEDGITQGNGITNEAAGDDKYTVQGKNVKVYDSQNKRNYTLVKEFVEHPGIADGEVSDLELLAAFCEAEAGDQGKIGMEAAALCALNRTIKADKEFPSKLRYVIYEGTSFAQYSVVSDGALLKKLKGQYYNRELAFEAAEEALKIFNNYVTKGTDRYLKGFDRKDFNFMYFMMEDSYWNQPLNFKKVDNFLYKDHMFFVDWVS